MSKDSSKPKHWVDEQHEKHECGAYRNPVTIPIVHEGQNLSLISPFDWKQIEIRSITFSSNRNLLYIIAMEPRKYFEPPFAGILIVATVREANHYEVVVWHDLYPWAIERLGLSHTNEV